MKNRINFGAIKCLITLVLFVAAAIICKCEMSAKGTFTGLTLIPMLIAAIFLGASMVIEDLREMREDDKLAPDESEAEDDEWW